MDIAFTHNLKRDLSEEEAEFDTQDTVRAISDALGKLGHRVDLVEVGGPPSRVLARLEALSPDLIFNTAEGRFGRYREAFYPGIFEQLGLPYTGSDAYVCTLTMDKYMAKMVLAGKGVRTPRSRLVFAAGEAESLDLAFPLILKPNYEGSSKGIDGDSIVEDFCALHERLPSLLRRYPGGILIEEYIEGRDIAVAFLEGVSPRTSGVLSPIEYVFAPDVVHGRKYQIYDYRLKNTDPDKVDVRVPAKLSPEALAKVTRYSQLVYRHLGLKDFGRIDFRVSGEDEVYFLEVNALPSLEPGAGLYLAAQEAGFREVKDVIGAIVENAARRHNIPGRRKSPLSTRGRLRVGFAYNMKRLKPEEDPSTDSEVEFDAPETLQAIRDAIASYGHEVVDLEAGPELPARLTTSDVDVVFNIAEGIKGRNREAQIPAMLELLDIPYTGSDAATMALALDKGLAKKIVREAGIRTPDFFLLKTGNERIPAELGFPALIKPVAEGSSKGVFKTSVVKEDRELREVALEISRKYNQPALVEEYLPGREFTVALIGERRPRVLPPMEIVFTDHAGDSPVYTYQHKLSPNKEIRYEVPARVPDALRNELETAARRVFSVLGCRDVARVDLRLDEKGKVCFLECNPLPGLTPGWSDLCLIAESAGIDYRTLIGEILAPAIRRFKEKRRLLLQAQAPAAVPA